MTQAYANAIPEIPRAALDGVRTRRLVALTLDFIAVSFIAAALYIALAVLTLGVSIFFLPPLWPIVGFFYNGATISGPRMGTPGMRAMDLCVRMRDNGAPTPFLNAAIHGALFYLSWMFPALFLVTLVDTDKRFLHDILSGVVVVRR